MHCRPWRWLANYLHNVGGSNELSNIAVARKIIEVLGMADRAESLITFVEDRHFNDLRYTIDTSKLQALGWEERTSWEEGLRKTVEWYKLHTGRFGNIESALVAHPRQGQERGIENFGTSPRHASAPAASK